MGLTEAGATVLSGGLNFLGNLGGAVSGGLFGANQARKNRQFQERMYNKQVEDNINFWKMQNEYNLPSAQRQRLEDAGLNPLLMYGEGGVQNVAQSPIQSAQAPHGAQAQTSSFHTPIELANIALVKEQANLLRTEAEKNRQDIAESEQRERGLKVQNEIQEATKDLQIAMKYGDNDLLSATLRKMQQDFYIAADINTQTVLTMIQAREYEAKRYNLSEYEVGQSVLQGWENVRTNKVQASASMKQAAASMMKAVNEARLVPHQIGVLTKNAALLSEQAETEKKLRPGKLTAQKWNNVGYVVDFLVKGADLEQKQVDILKSKIEVVKSGFGVDSYLGGILAPFTMGLGLHSLGSNYQDIENQYK